MPHHVWCNCKKDYVVQYTNSLYLYSNLSDRENKYVLYNISHIIDSNLVYSGIFRLKYYLFPHLPTAAL